MESVQLCRICNATSHGAHFGVDTCRACAAFFRRTVILRKKYVCRAGENKCEIRKDVRCMCRQCRWNKCLRVGMKSIYVKNKSIKCEEREEGIRLPEEIGTDVPMLSTSSENPYNKGTFANLLERIQYNYRQFVIIRRSTERAISQASYAGIFSPKPEKEILEAKFEMTCKIMRVTVPAMAEFVFQTFDGLGRLNAHEKMTVFKNFIPFMWIFEGAFLASKNFQPGENKCMLTLTTYIDFTATNTKDFFNDCASYAFDVAEVSRLLAKTLEKGKGLLMSLSKYKISDIEFCASIGLLLWNPNLYPSDNEHIGDVAQEERAKIFQDLQAYYRNEAYVEDHFSRLGELMCMFCSVQWNATVLKEDMELLNLFDVFNKDPILYEIIRS